MVTQSQDGRAPAPGPGQQGVYVYGILPGNVELEPGGTGVGDPPGEIRVVRHGGLAALVSDVDLDRPLGRPEDLMTHEELLDSSAAEVPVLPLRFGSVAASDEVVAAELLAPNYDEFASALRRLDGHAEYVVRGRYDRDAILREVLAENPRASQLCEQVQGTSPDSLRDLRMELAEIVLDTIAAKRDRDTRATGDATAGLVAGSAVRQPAHELDAVYIAFLVAVDKAGELEQALTRLAHDWRGRVELRLIGPLAAYDFADTEPETR
jgi:hypothetical protein